MTILKGEFTVIKNQSYVRPVAEGGVEGLPLRVEQVPDVTQTGDFKHLRLLLNHLSAQVRTDRGQSDWTQVFVSLHWL